MKHALRNESATVRIGKDGVSDQVLKEIDKQLQKNKMVKVKVLSSALGAEETNHIASNMAEQIGAYLVEVRGHTFMLFKRREK